jgi:hypothetical protein
MSAFGLTAIGNPQHWRDPMRSLHPGPPAVALAVTVLLALGAGAPERAQATTTTTSSSSSTSTTTKSTTTSTTSSTSTSTLPPALRCKNRLLGRGKKLVRQLARCRVRAVKRDKKGKPFDEAACLDAAVTRYNRRTAGSPEFARGCLDCTLADVLPFRDGLVATATDLDARIECDPAVPIADRAKCEVRLYKAVARFQAALMACRKQAAVLAFGGGTPAEAECIATAQTRFDTKFARLSCPACVDGSRIAGAAFEDTDNLITAAQCPCRYGDATACGECLTCDVADGCVAADEGKSCGRDGCTAQRCAGGTCASGSAVQCSDGDVCTVDMCLENEDPTCHGTTCCVHEPLCDPATLDPCVTECSCDQTTGCSCRCQPGCTYSGCVIFSTP